MYTRIQFVIKIWTTSQIMGNELNRNLVGESQGFGFTTLILLSEFNIVRDFPASFLRGIKSTARTLPRRKKPIKKGGM